MCRWLSSSRHSSGLGAAPTLLSPGPWSNDGAGSLLFNSYFSLPFLPGCLRTPLYEKRASASVTGLGAWSLLHRSQPSNCPCPLVSIPSEAIVHLGHTHSGRKDGASWDSASTASLSSSWSERLGPTEPREATGQDQGLAPPPSPQGGPCPAHSSRGAAPWALLQGAPAQDSRGQQPGGGGGGAGGPSPPRASE